MKKIILDTNFLFIPFEHNVDIFKEIRRIIDEPYELIMLQGSIDELKNLTKKGTGKQKSIAKAALALIENKKIKILKQKSLYMKINSKENVVDDIIVGISDENTIVATQDKELKQRLKIPLIILRNKNYLELKCSTKQQ